MINVLLIRMAKRREGGLPPKLALHETHSEQKVSWSQTMHCNELAIALYGLGDNALGPGGNVHRVHCNVQSRTKQSALNKSTEKDRAGQNRVH